jgi:pyridoxal phosphate enzyme (YggS family)
VTSLKANQIASRLAEVRARIDGAAAQAGRPPAAVRLIAVTKTQPLDVIDGARAAGLAAFGENRLEEALPKLAAAAAAGWRGVEWHLIGHIQSRKARAAAEAGFALIHSVDSLKLAERLSRFAAGAGRVLPVLLECNVSGEAAKAGFAAHQPAAWPALLATIGPLAALPGLEVRGLMTMAPIVAQPADARPCFARLRELRDFLRTQVPGAGWAELSMGMTDDFEAAVLEGATLVRIGRALFGDPLAA